MGNSVDKELGRNRDKASREDQDMEVHASSWCYCHSLSLAPVNPDWFYISGTSSPGSSDKGLLNGVVAILTYIHTIIDFPNLGITYNGGWCSATISRWNSYL